MYLSFIPIVQPPLKRGRDKHRLTLYAENEASREQIYVLASKQTSLCGGNILTRETYYGAIICVFLSARRVLYRKTCIITSLIHKLNEKALSVS